MNTLAGWGIAFFEYCLAVPAMSAGATDGAFLTPVGIPTYGVSGIFFDTDGNGAHGLNERVGVDATYIGRDFLYDAVKIYANQP